MAQTDGWLEAGSGSGDMWDESNGPIQGVYIKKRTNVGPNESNVYTLRTENGEVGVWGSTVINTKFDEIPIGSMVRVEFIGKVSGKRGGSQYKDYQIKYKPDPDAVPLPLSGEVVDEDEDPKDDVVIQDLDNTSSINLDDIPF